MKAIDWILFTVVFAFSLALIVCGVLMSITASSTIWLVLGAILMSMGAYSTYNTFKTLHFHLRYRRFGE